MILIGPVKLKMYKRNKHFFAYEMNRKFNLYTVFAYNEYYWGKFSRGHI